MMKLVLTLSLLLSGQVVPTLAQVIEDRESDDIYPGNVEWVDSNAKTLVNRIVDAETGLPIPRATMTVMGDEPFPIPGSSRVIGVATADDDGWVRMDGSVIVDGSCDWLVFDAPGYSPYAVHEYAGDYPIRLQPGMNAWIRVVNQNGENLSGIELELLLGCGHDAASRFAKSNESGLAVFKDVKPDIPTAQLWMRGSGIVSEYRHWGSLIDPLEIVKLVVEETPDIVGRVVDAEGQPIVGAYLGLNNCKRGPWFQTDVHGRFRVMGISDGVIAVHLPTSAGPWIKAPYVDRPQEGTALEIVLDKDGALLSSRRKTAVQEDETAPENIREFKVILPGSETDVVRYEIHMTRGGDDFSQLYRVEATETSMDLDVASPWHIVVVDEEAVCFLDRELAPEELAAGQLVFPLPERPLVGALPGQGDTSPEALALRVSVLSGELQPVFLVADEGERDITKMLEWVTRHDAKDEPDGIARDIYGIDLLVKGLKNPRIEIRRKFEDEYDERVIPSDQQSFQLDPEAQSQTIQSHVYVLDLPGFRGPDGEVLDAAYGLCWERETELELREYSPETLYDYAPRHRALISGSIPPWLVLFAEDLALSPIWLDLNQLDPKKAVHQFEEQVFARRGPALIEVKLPTKEIEESMSLMLWDSLEWAQSYQLVDEHSGLDALVLKDLPGRNFAVAGHNSPDRAIRIVPLQGRLDGSGPWQVTWPDTIFRLRVQFRPGEKPEEADQPIWMALDGEEESISVDLEEVTILGLSPGKHRLLLAIPGFRSRRIDFNFDSSLDLRVTLVPTQE